MELFDDITDREDDMKDRARDMSEDELYDYISDKDLEDQLDILLSLE